MTEESVPLSDSQTAMIRHKCVTGSRAKIIITGEAATSDKISGPMPSKQIPPK